MFTVDTDKIIAGALPLCILAILADFLLVKLQHKLEVWRDDTQEKNKNLVKEG
jgi:ABC-type proline/glycine betaine transport system permease subunit